MLSKQRKVLVFLLYVVIGIIVSLFMPIEFYDRFMYYTFLMATGFFAGNAIEHIADALKGKKDDNKTGIETNCQGQPE